MNKNKQRKRGFTLIEIMVVVVIIVIGLGFLIPSLSAAYATRRLKNATPPTIAQVRNA